METKNEKNKPIKVTKSYTAPEKVPFKLGAKKGKSDKGVFVSNGYILFYNPPRNLRFGDYLEESGARLQEILNDPARQDVSLSWDNLGKVKVVPEWVMKQGSCTVVYFSNGVAMDKDYFDLALKYYPKAEWFAEGVTPHKSPTGIFIFRDKGKFLGSIMGLRSSKFPPELQKAYSRFVVTWYGLLDDFSKTITMKSFGKPYTENVSWFPTKSELKTHLAGRISALQTNIKTEQARVRRLKDELANAKNLQVKLGAK